jgi:hypothetical protein
MGMKLKLGGCRVDTFRRDACIDILPIRIALFQTVSAADVGEERCIQDLGERT